MVYNKIDKVEKESEEEEEGSESEVKESEKGVKGTNELFISAANKLNIDALRDKLYEEVSRIHAIRYPYNNFLY